MNLKGIILLLTAFVLTISTSFSQFLEKDHLFLVLLKVDSQQQASLCHSDTFDQNRVQIDFAFEDTVNNLGDFEFEEDAMEGPNCFIPELKLIFRDYTYVTSLYCSKFVKYRNKAPHQPSSKRMRNDLVMTPGVFAFLQQMKETHFETAEISSDSTLDQMLVTEPLEEPTTDSELLNLLLAEDETTEESSDLLIQPQRFLEEEKEVEVEEIDDP